MSRTLKAKPKTLPAEADPRAAARAELRRLLDLVPPESPDDPTLEEIVEFVHQVRREQAHAEGRD